MHISFDRNPFLHTEPNALQCRLDKCLPPSVIGRGDTIFGNKQISLKIFRHPA